MWIHYERQWLAAAELIDGYADAPLLEVYEPDDDLTERTLAAMYPAWHAQAACLGMDEEDFFGARDTTERPALSMTAMSAAQQICTDCPVFRTCLTEALVTRNEYGIWASTSGRTRRRIWEAVDAGLTTLAEVIEAYVSGTGERYDRKPSAATVTRRELAS